MGSYNSYPKVYALGHAAIRDMFLDPVLVEEKVDGSQFSFGLIDGELRCRSRNQQLDWDNPQKMFELALATVKELEPHLHPEWTYRGEYLNKPKHNVLAYDRIPLKGIILFDINTGDQEYLSREEKIMEAVRLGLECVPSFGTMSITSPEEVEKLLETISLLGGNKVEGLVFKNYTRFGKDGKAFIGKYVSEAFKEIAGGDWKKRHPGSSDIITILATKYRTPARWEKSIQHLREKGELEDSPRDIGKIMKEINLDILEECSEEISEVLFKWGWKKMQRGFTQGVPEWYKKKLMEAQFAE